MRKWLPQFYDNEILIYWADISSLSKAKESLVQLHLISEKIPTKQCVFILFIGHNDLIKNLTEEELSNFSNLGDGEKDIFHFLEHKFKKAAKPLFEDINPSFAIFTEKIDKRINIKKSIMDKVQEVVESLAYFRLAGNM